MYQIERRVIQCFSVRGTKIASWIINCFIVDYVKVKIVRLATNAQAKQGNLNDWNQKFVAKETINKENPVLKILQWTLCDSADK